MTSIPRRDSAPREPHGLTSLDAARARRPRPQLSLTAQVHHVGGGIWQAVDEILRYAGGPPRAFDAQLAAIRRDAHRSLDAAFDQLAWTVHDGFFGPPTAATSLWALAVRR